MAPPAEPGRSARPDVHRPAAADRTRPALSRATNNRCSARWTFSVDAGEALLVQGDNGAGKTTLLRVLAGPVAGR
jgi:ABC-type uncharacterized transport system ATPase subunit